MLESTNWSLSLTDIQDLRDNAVIVLGLYQTMHELHEKNNSSLDALKKYIKKLLEACDKTFNGFDENFYETLSEEAATQMIDNLATLDNPAQVLPLDIKEMYLTGHYFPAYPIQRKIPRVKVKGEYNEKDSSCSKNYKQKGQNTPGVVFFFCMEHEKCIGFIIQDESEGPKMVTEAIATRFKKVPEYIVYDNSCNLAEYCLLRYPTLFKDSIFLVDSFHFKSHINCCSSFDCSITGAVTAINSSLAEQKNSKITMFKQTSILLKAKTFMLKMRYAMSYINNSQKKNK